MLATPARRLTPRKLGLEFSPPEGVARGAASAASPSAPPQQVSAVAAAGVDAMTAKQVLALAAAVATVWALLAAAAFGSGPLFLVRPPITRRSSGYEFQGRDCSYALALGSWTDAFQTVTCSDASRAAFATCGDTPQRHWRFDGAAERCGARRMAAGEARGLLAGKRVVFAGDSIARNLYGATLRLLGSPGQDVVVGHADFQHSLEGDILLQFYWAPYPENLTALLAQPALGGDGGSARTHQAAAGQAGAQEGGAAEAREQTDAQFKAEAEAELQRAVGAGGQGAGATGQAQQEQQQQAEAEEEAKQGQQEGEQEQTQEQQEQDGGEAAAGGAGGRRLRAEQPAPALAVLSTTLWHLLHVTQPADFQRRLGELRGAAEGFAGGTAASGGAASVSGAAGAAGGPRLVLASGTETYPNKMKTIEKQGAMTPANLDAYNQAIEQSGLLAPDGPFALLDLFTLTNSCGEECSVDGVHSLPAVYDAALQLLLNVVAAGQRGGAKPQGEAPRRALRAARGA